MGSAAFCCIQKGHIKLKKSIMQIFKGKATFFSVVAFAILLLLAGMLLPSASPPPSADLPWKIEQSAASVSVFGLILGRSTLNEAQIKFHEQAELSLFVSDSGIYSVEAYFDRVNPGGLAAKVVLTAALSQVEMQAMFERSLRTSALGSGRKADLHPNDSEKVHSTEIASITYLPSVTLNEEMIVQHFGSPTRRVREKKNDVLHFLYPESGLDIALNSNNKAVLQYFPPQNFTALMTPLLAEVN